MYSCPMSTGYRSRMWQRSIVSSRDQPCATALATIDFHSSRTAFWVWR